jgi:hypothetical protein
MRFPQQFRMTITRRGEKERRLGAFIAQGIQGLSVSDRSAGGPPILVIARSAQSPVVKSIATLARELAGSGCAVRMILARTDRSALTSVLIAARQAMLDCEARRSHNPSLIEVHEQLVLGARSCWTGDSMRRDPATCDAYESFVEDCAETAAGAAAMFERMWNDSEPFPEIAAVVPAVTTPKAIRPRLS